MNKNSLFTKAIAAFLAVLMVLGTLVSLRGFEVKAEAVVDNSAVRSEASPEGTKDGSIDYRVVSDSPTDIYEIPHSLRITKYYDSSNPYDYRQYEKFTVDWFESGKVAVHGHTTRNTYGYDMNVDGSNTRLYLAQDQYWEPGAKNAVGGNPVTYTAPVKENFPKWVEDENIDWINERVVQWDPGYSLFSNKSTANKNFWLSGEDGESIWNKARMLVYMADPAGLRLVVDEYLSDTRLRSAVYYALIDGNRYELEYEPMTREEMTSIVLLGLKLTTRFKIIVPEEMSGSVSAGQYAVLCVESQRVDDVLLIPSGAIYSSAAERYVYVIGEDGTRERRVIELGRTNGVDTVVTSGLEEGEIIYVKE